jgi:APA family basic amino acid/polyamine antiporter
VRRTGGPYTFALAAFGRFAGLATGLANCLAYCAVAGFISVVFGEFLHRLGILTAVPIGVIAILEIAVLAAIQSLGTRISGLSQEIGSVFKALVFAILIVALLLSPRGAPVAQALAIPAPVTFAGMIFAARAILGAFGGWEAASYFAEEITDLRRDFTRATFGGIALVTIVYVLINVAVLHVMSVDDMAKSTLVAADASGRIFGQAGDTIVNAVALLSVVTILNIVLMMIPRILYAIAVDFEIPKLDRVTAGGTPIYAVATIAVIGAMLGASGVYLFALQYSTWLLVLMAVIVDLAALVLRLRQPELERPWKMPLFPIPTIIGLTVNFALLVAFSWEAPATSAAAAAGLLGATALIWLVTRSKWKRKTLQAIA